MGRGHFCFVFFKVSLTLNTVKTTNTYKFILQMRSAERGRRYRILHHIYIASEITSALSDELKNINGMLITGIKRHLVIINSTGIYTNSN